MMSFPNIETHLGKYVDQLVSFIDKNFEGFFDFIFFIASRTINGIDDLLMWLPWWVFILIIFLFGWYFKTAISGVLYGFYIFLIGTFGLWDDMMTTIAIILTAVSICLVIGIPWWDN